MKDPRNLRSRKGSLPSCHELLWCPTSYNFIKGLRAQVGITKVSFPKSAPNSAKIPDISVHLSWNKFFLIKVYQYFAVNSWSHLPIILSNITEITRTSMNFTTWTVCDNLTTTLLKGTKDNTYFFLHKKKERISLQI